MADEKETVRINVPVDKELHRQLRIQAARESLDLKDLVPRLLEEALKRLQTEQGDKGGSGGSLGACPA